MLQSAAATDEKRISSVSELMLLMDSRCRDAPSLCSPLLFVSIGLSCIFVCWLCQSEDQCLCVGLLQAERAVVRKRMVVVVFDQSWQSGEGHFAVQKDVVLLCKQPVVSGFAYSDIPHHQHLWCFGSWVSDAIQSVQWRDWALSE